MIKSKGIFAVSFIAMMVVGGAYANIASQGYVDQQIDTRAPAGDYATKTELNAKQNASTAVEVATAGTAVGDATHPIYVNASGVATRIDKVAAAATADTATTADSATKATQDAAGNVIADTYATKAEIPDEITVDAALSADSTNPVQNKVVKAALDAKADSTELDNVLKNTATTPSDGSVATAGALVAQDGALAIGKLAAGAGALSVVVGGSASTAADANASVVVGNNARALSGASASVAVGLGAETKGTGAVSVGWGTGAVNNATAVGYDSEVTGPLGVAVGSASKATGERSVAVGPNSTADGDYAIQLGAGQNINDGTFNVGLGADKNYQLLDNDGKIPDARMPDTVLTNTATDPNSFAVGGADAGTYQGAVVTGVDASASGNAATVYGLLASAGELGTAVGNGATAAVTSVAVGSGSDASGTTSTAVGGAAKATGERSIQLGQGTNSEPKTFSVGLGDSTSENYTLLKADGTIPAERMPDTVLTNTATGVGAFATGGGDAGNYTSATIIGARAMTAANGGTVYGSSAKATGGGGTAIGTTASAAQNAVALGTAARGDGIYSVALGMGSVVSGENSIGIGYGSVVNGTDAIGIGEGTVARGANSVVVGNEAGAGANNSISLGFGASTNAESAIQIGTGTNLDPGTLSVGFGDSGNYRLLDSSGKIPGERLQISVGSATEPTGYADIWIE